MRKVWIVVANSSQSKIYRAENVNTLCELATFEHPESHMAAHDLVSDREGRATSHGAAKINTLEEKTSPKLKEKMHFADQIARYLEEGYNKGEFERIYLIANPSFLGQLRQSINGNVAKSIEKEITKDLTSFKPDVIREYLPPVL